MMDPLGVEPRFQEPESRVRSITLRVPITVINYSRVQQNGKSKKGKKCKKESKCFKKVKKMQRLVKSFSISNKKLAYLVNSAILKVSREKWRLSEVLFLLYF